MAEYTIQEAFKKELLYNEDIVRWSTMYWNKTGIVIPNNNNRAFFCMWTVEAILGKFSLGDKGRIFKEEENFFMKIFCYDSRSREWYKRLRGDINSSLLKKLFSIPEFNVNVEDISSEEMIVRLAPNIIVRFDRTDSASLYLPGHNVYHIS